MGRFTTIESRSSRSERSFSISLIICDRYGVSYAENGVSESPEYLMRHGSGIG